MQDAGQGCSLRRTTRCRFWRRELSYSCCFFLASSWVTMQRSHSPARSLRGEEGWREAALRGGAGIPHPQDLPCLSPLCCPPCGLSTPQAIEFGKEP